MIKSSAINNNLSKLSKIQKILNLRDLSEIHLELILMTNLLPLDR